MCFPLMKQRFFQRAERELRPCPFLPVFLLLFITTATTATMMVTAPRIIRPVMTAMMGTVD